MTQPLPEPRWWQGVIQWIAGTRVGAWLLSHTAHHIDRLLLTLTGGHLSTSELLAGAPTIQLTTIGAKSGKERTVPVMGLPAGENRILFASNWGDQRHPSWYHNLRANPEVTVTTNGQTTRYTAREVTGEERATYFRRAKELYPPFEAYHRRAGNREIPVIVLEPIDT